MTRIGIIGVGYLGECLAEGLLASGEELMLSPRNKERVARLAERPGCKVAKDNKHVVEECDVVFLATEPDKTVSVTQNLPWREGQRAISVAAGLGLAILESTLAPAKAIRSMPIAASRIRKSPSAFCPPDDIAETVLSKIGSAYPVTSEAQFETASIFGAYYGLVYALMEQASAWAKENGLDPAVAQGLAVNMTGAASVAVANQGRQSPGELLSGLMTEGGITAAGHTVLETSGALEQLAKALDASLVRSREINRENKTGAR
jgi:pyrroline-5-carboxylate reductase